MRIISCPLCQKEMDIVNIENVEIDKCPYCEGIWLDRGEMEQLAEQERQRVLDSIESGDNEFINILDVLLEQLFPNKETTEA